MQLCPKPEPVICQCPQLKCLKQDCPILNCPKTDCPQKDCSLLNYPIETKCPRCKCPEYPEPRRQRNKTPRCPKIKQRKCPDCNDFIKPNLNDNFSHHPHKNCHGLSKMFYTKDVEAILVEFLIKHSLGNAFCKFLDSPSFTKTIANAHRRQTNLIKSAKINFKECRRRYPCTIHDCGSICLNEKYYWHG